MTKDINFFNSLIDKAKNQLHCTSNYSYPKNIENYNEPFNLKEIIGVKENLLSDNAKNVLNILENITNEDVKNDYLDFKWKVTAFINIQDIFDMLIFERKELLGFSHLWYFYYESKYILIESILCGLNGFSLANKSLVRLFVEFNLLQNYFYRLVKSESNYNKLEKYFENDIKPNWNTVINKCLPNNTFTKPIKKRLQLLLKALSETSSHPYNPISSPKLNGSFTPETTLVNIYFWHLLKMTIEPVLWIYYVNFPMLFHPVNILNKFGFNYPVGLFVNEVCGHVIKKSLSEDSYNDFFNYSNNNEDVKYILDFYNSRKDMSEKEILKTWNYNDDGQINNIIEGYCMQIAKLRVLREMISLKMDNNLMKKLDDIDFDKLIESLSYDKWKQIYKRI